MAVNQIRLSAPDQKILGVNYDRYQPPEFSSILQSGGSDTSSALKIALVFTGRVDSLEVVEQSLDSFQKHLIEEYPRHHFDYFISTWDSGLSTQEINHLRQKYKIRKIQLDSWSDWINQPNLLPEWSRRFPQEDLNNLLNRVYAQFYRASQGVILCLNYAREKEFSYDLIIRSRLDLELLLSQNRINWSQLVNKTSDHLVGVRYWQPNGLENKIIVGSSSIMEVYSQIWGFLKSLREEQVREILLTTIYVPELFVHYENIIDQTSLELYQRESKFIKDKFLKFIDDPGNLKIYQRIIPERLLLYYLNQMKILIHVEDYLIEYRILENDKNKSDRNKKSINF